jgi:mono/diheme cytochrome c family protein
LNEEQGAAVKEFVNAGNGPYAVHNSSHISHSSKNFREVMGGAYIGHPTLRPFKVRVVNNDHPVTQGIQEFIVNDEQHYVDYDKDHKHILMETENVDGLDYNGLGTKSISASAYDYGQGRVAFSEMPAFPLSEVQAKEIVAYLRSLAPAPEAASKGDPVAGRALFFGSAGCSKCHMFFGQGGRLGPDLSVPAGGRQPVNPRQAILNPDESLRRGYETVEVQLNNAAR